MNRTCAPRRSAIVGFFSVVISVISLFAAPLAGHAATVTTLAGSGAPGFADGPAGSATFLMPVALAYDGRGNLYVVDAAAQRIRKISPDGAVETIAGGGSLAPHAAAVLGGFADGPAGVARFNWPRGIAVAKDGTAYIADTGNHVIRTITPDGRVAVFAGSVLRSGKAVGPRLRATFGAPTGLALDAKGDLFVADPIAGIRKIDAAGNVTEVPLGHDPTGVSVTQTNGTLTLYIADRDGILIAYPDGRLIRMRSANAPSNVGAVPAAADPAGTIEKAIAMSAPLGFLLSLSALPSDNVFFADPRTNAIRYVFEPYAYARVVAGAPGEDAAGETAGFRDGPADQARFNAPLGTAMAAEGVVAIADAGNRRIRVLKLAASELAQESALVPVDDVPENAYRIVYVGPSWTFYDSVAGNSISGLLQQRLIDDGVLASAGLVPAVRFVNGVGNLDPLESVVRTIADLGIDKVVMLDLTSLSVVPDIVHADETAPQWRSALITRLRAARDILAGAHIRFVAVVHPFAMEFSANETPMARMGFEHIGSGMVPNVHLIDLVRDAVRASGVDFIDTVPDFRRDALHPDMPVSGMADAHYTPYGRAIMATAIARGLEDLRPWRKL